MITAEEARKLRDNDLRKKLVEAHTKRIVDNVDQLIRKFAETSTSVDYKEFGYMANTHLSADELTKAVEAAKIQIAESGFQVNYMIYEDGVPSHSRNVIMTVSWE